jgi:hypothetical protein
MALHKKAEKNYRFVLKENLEVYSSYKTPRNSEGKIRNSMHKDEQGLASNVA